LKAQCTWKQPLTGSRSRSNLVLKVGFIGLGRMGAGMAANLVKAGDLWVPMPRASLLRDRFLTLLAQEGEARDWAAIGQLAAQDAGL
jgi:hypothetical protein